MNIWRVKLKFKNFLILLDSGFSPTILMGRLIEKLDPLKDAVMQWHTQAGKINTISKVKIYFTLPKISETEILIWNCHVGDSAKGRYDMILGIYLLK